MLNVNESIQIHFFTFNDRTFLYINVYEAHVFSSIRCVCALTHPPHTHNLIHSFTYTNNGRHLLFSTCYLDSLSYTPNYVLSFVGMLFLTFSIVVDINNFLPFLFIPWILFIPFKSFLNFLFLNSFSVLLLHHVLSLTHCFSIPFIDIYFFLFHSLLFTFLYF